MISPSLATFFLPAQSAIEMIVRDLGELTRAGGIGLVIATLILLILPVSAGLALKGARPARISTALALTMWVLWLLYYATDWVPNPGQRAILVPLTLTLLAWLPVLPLLLTRLRPTR